MLIIDKITVIQSIHFYHFISIVDNNLVNKTKLADDEQNLMAFHQRC